MILGSFSINQEVVSVTERIRKATDYPGVTFHPVVKGGFSGGYYLNRQLPYASDDYYFLDEQDDIMVLISGCIYNRSELLHLCNGRNPISDPEIVACLFRNEGPLFVNRLNGDFTIFILQPAGNQAYLFRDHVGIRPMAWTDNTQVFCFSSDIIGLCQAFSEGKRIDSEYLMRYFKYIDYRKTPLDQVNKLLPGHFLHISDKGLEVVKYWRPEKIRISRKLDYETMLSELEKIVRDAIKIRCDQQFTAGAHVSGGLDSGFVSTLARREYHRQKNFYGFSWSPVNFTPVNVKYDERELASKCAENAGINVLFSDMTVADFVRLVSDFYGNQGYYLEDKTVEQAAGVNTNLILSGWGGDEFISTGGWAIEQDLLFKLKLRTFFRRNKVKHPKEFIRNTLYFILLPALRILDMSTLQSFRNDARYLKKQFKKSNRRALGHFFLHSSRHQFHLGMLRLYHLQERCESWSVNGFRKGVEYRFPLLDRRIIEYMLQVPSELLCRTDHIRPLLRLISEGVLPDEIRWQNEKTDPVCWGYMAGLYKEASSSFTEELDEWKSNPELHFIDFEQLTEDITKSKKSPDSVDEKLLFRSMMYIKAIHNFTKKFHKLERII